MNTEPSPIIRLYDRSRVVCDWRCPRERYLRYEYDGRGIINPHSNLELFLGTQVHDGLAAIAQGIDIDVLANTQAQGTYNGLMENVGDDPKAETFAQEQAALVEGLLRGFYKHSWDKLLSEYGEIACVEQEMVYKHDNLIFMSKPDLVLRNAEGLWYIEYKTTSTKREGWINSWSTAVQLHSTIRAIETVLGEKVAGVIVQGLYKGYEAYGKQSSPFCYAYRRQGQPPFSQTDTRYDYQAGYKKYPAWQLEEGVKGWVQDMPEHILTDQFPQTPPIYVNDDLIDRWFRQRSVREKEIQFGMTVVNSTEGEVQQTALDTFFPQRFDQCHPSWGRKCTYARICHGHVSDPLSEGYEYRTSHHELERQQNEGE